MSTKISVSIGAGQEKCSRNKRKFRQDPPFSNQGSSDDNAGSTSSIEEDTTSPESRSNCGSIGKGICRDSSQKESISCGASSLRKCEAARSYLEHFKQEHSKFMKCFRSGQAKTAQARIDGKPEQLMEGQDQGQSINSLKDEESSELEEVEWDDHTEGELEDLLVKSLGPVYNEAINKIEAAGHGAEDALGAVLRHGCCYGAKDAVSNIVDNSLAYLNDIKSHAAECTDRSFSDLKELQRYSLTEMVGLIRELRPMLSKGDAMWSLLMYDMNVDACVKEDSAFPSLHKEPFQSLSASHFAEEKGESFGSLPEESTSTDLSSDASSVTLADRRPAAAIALAQGGTVSQPSVPSLSCSTLPVSPPRKVPSPFSSVLLSESYSPKLPLPLVPLLPTAEVPLLSLSDSISHSESGAVTAEELSVSPNVADAAPRHNCASEEKQLDVPKHCIETPAIEKLKLDDKVYLEQGLRESEEIKAIAGVSHDLCLKSPHSTSQRIGVIAETSSVENINPTKMPDGTSVPAFVLEKHEESESQSGVVSVVSRSAMKAQWSPSTTSSTQVDGIGKVTISGQDGCQCVRTVNGDSIDGPEPRSSGVGCQIVADHSTLAVDKQNESSIVPVSHAESSSTVDESIASNSLLQAAKLVKMDPECLSQEIALAERGETDKQKDEFIAKLVHRVRELEMQLQERIEWAKQKVMQAARRLSKDLQELRALRLEREQWLRLKRDKQAVEDSSMKQIKDLENELRKTKGNVDSANALVFKVEVQNKEICAEMEAAKLSAAEAQTSCEELVKRERKYMKKAQAWEKQKAKWQEELSEEKKTVIALQQQLVLAKERQHQAEVRWRQEEKAREDATLRADYEKRTREQYEAAAKKREEALHRKIESNYQRHREDIHRLEGEIAQFRTSTEAAQLATSRWGPGVAVTRNMVELGSIQALKESNNRLSRELSELQDLGWRDISRERECVMCMCEEMSVVFLPCAHQVICVKCNELHEKQGMRDCPSCRTTIKQRIRVFGVSAQ